MSDDLMNIILRAVETALAGKHHTRTGLVTSYDSKTHSAKVMIKPDDVQTGWVPIHTSHVGNGWGILVGLTPGDGKKTGDQVEMTFTEGDLEQGRIQYRLHSDVDRPPKVESGEILVQHQKGHYVFFDKDGGLRIFHNAGDPPKGGDPPPSDNGTYIKIDKDGNATVNSNKKTLTLDDGNGATHVHDGSGNISRKANKIDDTAAQGDFSRTSSSGNITDTASNIAHNGPTNVQGTLNVQQLLSALGGASILGGLSGGGGLNMSGLSSLLGGASVTGGLTADKILAPLLGSFANDAAAAAGGVAVGQMYRTASSVQVRVT